MCDENRIELPENDRERVHRLLNNGGPVPDLFLAWLTTPNGVIHVRLSDIVKFLERLEENCISDQKQEAYKGLREVITRIALG